MTDIVPNPEASSSTSCASHGSDDRQAAVAGELASRLPPPQGPFEARVLAEETLNASKFRMRVAEGRKRTTTMELSLGDLDDEDEQDISADAAKGFGRPSASIPLADHCAVRLQLARLMDANPDATSAIMSRSSLVCIDVPDTTAFMLVRKHWRTVLLPSDWKVASFDSSSLLGSRQNYDAIAMIVKEKVKPREVVERDLKAMTAYQCALPIVAITPDARSHLAPLLCEAIDHQLEFPKLDDVVVRRTIEIVTGSVCTTEIDPAVVAVTGLNELALAVRIDRTAEESVAALARFAAAKASKKDPRDISLDQLFGLDDAVAWARSSIRDLREWKLGQIGWNAVASNICLVGPPGTGKTSFARIFAAEAGISIVAATLGRWQGTGDGHLGTSCGRCTPISSSLDPWLRA